MSGAELISVVKLGVFVTGKEKYLKGCERTAFRAQSLSVYNGPAVFVLPIQYNSHEYSTVIIPRLSRGRTGD